METNCWKLIDRTNKGKTKINADKQREGKREEGNQRIHGQQNDTFACTCIGIVIERKHLPTHESIRYICAFMLTDWNTRSLDVAHVG